MSEPVLRPDLIQERRLNQATLTGMFFAFTDQQAIAQKDPRALKGPADRLLAELGHEVSCLGVLDFYKGLVGRWIIDEADHERAAAVRGRGVEVTVTTTIMSDAENARRLAAAVLT